jgi:hypothetical protein
MIGTAARDHTGLEQALERLKIAEAIVAELGGQGPCVGG